MASYTIIDHSDTLVKLTEDGREYFYKKVYCKTDVDGNYLLFFSHELETGRLNQQYQILYSDCTNPSVASASLLKTAVDAIINDYVGGGGITALTGDVTATGPGSVAATIANDAVTYAKMQNVSAASRLLGRGDSGAGDVQEIVLGTGLSMSGTTLNASGGSFDANKTMAYTAAY